MDAVFANKSENCGNLSGWSNVSSSSSLCHPHI
jgi:hypothetical protein